MFFNIYGLHRIFITLKPSENTRFSTNWPKVLPSQTTFAIWDQQTLSCTKHKQKPNFITNFKSSTQETVRCQFSLHLYDNWIHLVHLARNFQREKRNLLYMERQRLSSNIVYVTAAFELFCWVFNCCLAVGLVILIKILKFKFWFFLLKF